jgi:hypothetical protein
MVEEYLDSISEKDDKKESVVERIDRIIGKYGIGLKFLRMAIIKSKFVHGNMKIT